jgi:dipeptidyl-peptidase-4
VIDGTLWLLGPSPRPLVSPKNEFTSFGLPDFLAAEEFNRHRGFWWSPDGNQLLVQEVDTSNVGQWWISDASSPAAEPRSVRYPAAGNQNPASQLWLVDLAGNTTCVEALSEEDCYLTRVEWNSTRGLMVTVLNRAQDRMRVINVQPSDGSATELMALTDPHWVEVLDGLPTWAPKSSGANVLHIVDDLNANTRRLALDGRVFSDQKIIIDSVIAVHDDGVIAAGFITPLTRQIFKFDWTGAAQKMTDDSGWGAAVSAPGQAREQVLLVQANPKSLEPKIWLHGGSQLKLQTPGASLAEQRVEFVVDSPYPTAIVWPQSFLRDSEKLPVVLAPYGGPHGRRVINASPRTFASAQLLANQGFAVVVIDGPGTPGLGPVVEKMVVGDLLSPAIEGQVSGLAHVLREYPDSLDGSRVGIHGWSFGGYLAAGAVLLRPDVFHAAIAGAPVSDWRLYDTAYSERYLGQPHGDTLASYQRSTLLPLATGLSRPLLLVHGVADDNVFFAHTLQLSGALTAAGKQHSVLPLSGATHMTSDVTLTERLEQLAIDFFTRHLKLND